MNKALLGVVVVVVVVVGAVLLMNQDASAPTTEDEQAQNNPTPTPPANNPTPSQTETTPPSPNPTTAQPAEHQISMMDSGYTPNTLTIKKGDTVKFTNNGTKPNWPASAPHPSHTDYPAFDPKQGIAVGSSWSFTFDRTGTWRFHDHLNPTRFGSITVTE